ncbi:flagellar basal body P-ring formation protein FlgA [Pseudoalteromonas sp. JBTF-M23]|uniref:Flagella basal body P-ring formation protein FlgA n=1 Tax=Pseudoalteromonas caenipelagi TaxID=2726988 RepID=A0A849VAU2_9GAMM|nr:flagellar basal body P-ring formation chaperone FlgA [Pseudoalteromonas caenipelagi]NOU50759.1 flagellar basal body P-ring formation protein FlgA [Pseudoalteromonas caenipelagi]
MSLLKKTKSAGFFFAMVYILLSDAVYAQDYNNQALEEAARSFISNLATQKPDSNLQIRAIPLDARLPTRQCETPLDISTNASAPFNRQVTVQLKCEDLSGWTQYVHIRIEELFPVIVSTEMISKGELLTEQHLRLEYRPKHFVRASYIDDINLLIGSRSKRVLREGMPVGMHQICMVCKGDIVSIYAKTQTLTIKTQGIALQDGNIGEQIRVKNQKSGKIVSGRVKDVDSIEVNI